MRNRVLYVLLLILLVGCGRPWGVLSHDDMVDVLLDIHIAEASIKILDLGAKRIEKQEYYNKIFEKHNTTKEQFDKSLDWYSCHSKELISIYEDVREEAVALQKRIEKYEFHPDMKPTLEDSLETFDLWHWYVEKSFKLNQDSLLPIDSLHFAITDSNYFYKSESLQFYLKMRVYAPDTVPFTTRLVFHYSDSVVDTLQYVSLADSVCRRYRFNQVFSDVRDLDSLFIEIVDSARTIETIEIDSIELNRVYNKELYPLNKDFKNQIKDIRDSLSGKEYKSEIYTVKNRWKI
jgi:hypothetical protein